MKIKLLLKKYAPKRMANIYPKADGSFIQADMTENWNDIKWQSEFKYLREAGMHYIIINTSVTEKGILKTIYPSRIPSVQKQYGSRDIVNSCLKNAEKYGIKVFLGININSEWWNKYGTDSKWLNAQMVTGNLVVDELYEKYHSKYPNSFYGWYWVYEVDNLNFRTKRQFRILSEALDINLKHMKEKKERLPVMLSPFMNSNFGNPKQYADNWAYLFSISSLQSGDIFCPQDCVGGGGLKLTEVKYWFAALSSAVKNKNGLLFWSNAETFDHTNWCSAPLNRFIKQLKIEKPFVSNIITFAYSHYYSPNNINPEFHKIYLDYLKTGFLEKKKPAAPEVIQVKKMDSIRVEISWEPPSCNSGIFGYILKRNNHVIFSTFAQRKFGGKTQKEPLLNYLEWPPKNLKICAYSIVSVDFAGNISNSRMTFVNLSKLL